MTMAERQQTPRWLHTPAETATAYVKWAERLRSDPGITYGCVLDKVMIPLHPGDLMAVVARPGHGKTSYMAYMARRAAEDIVRRNAADSEAAIYISWEQSVEEIEAFFQSGRQYTSTDLAWGRVPTDVIIKACLDRPSLPVWLMGKSVMATDPHRKPMFVEDVFNEIRWLGDKFGIKPVLLCLDYIQNISVPGSVERSRQVHEAVISAKELAMDVGCPVIAGVQASRETDDRKSPIPTMADSQWSSSIEQTADKQIALWRPSRTEEAKPADERKMVVKVSNAEYPIVPELLVIRVLKQRFDIGCGTYAVHFEPQTLKMTDYDVHQLEPVPIIRDIEF